MLEVDGRPFCCIGFHEPSGHPDNGGTGGDVFYDYGSGSNFRPGSYGNCSENSAIGTHYNPASQGGMAFLLLQGGSTKDHPRVDQAIVSNLGRLADHHPHSVVDEEAAPNCRPGMDLNSCKCAADMGYDPGEGVPVVVV